MTLCSIFNTMKNKYYLYEIINKNPNKTMNDLANIVKWKSKKLRYYIKKLITDKVVLSFIEIVNEKTTIRYIPVSFKEFINRKKMNFLYK